MRGKCTIEKCDDDLYAKGMCVKHYFRNRRNGDPHVLKRRPRIPRAVTEEHWDWVYDSLETIQGVVNGFFASNTAPSHMTREDAVQECCVALATRIADDQRIAIESHADYVAMIAWNVLKKLAGERVPEPTVSSLNVLKEVG